MQRKMESFTITTTSKSNSLPYTTNSPFPLKPQHKDHSFSTYLQPQAPPSPPSPPKPMPLLDPISFQVIDETEISIFDAENYFNEGQDHQEEETQKSSFSPGFDEQSLPRFSSVSSVDGRRQSYRTQSFHATPTASSEASWNSQTGLLSNPPGSISVSMRNLHLDGKKKGSSGKWFFGNRCPCLGKKAVQVEEKFAEPKTPFPVICDSNSSLSSRTQSSKTGERQSTQARAIVGALDEKAKEMHKSLEIHEREEVKFANGNGVKYEDIVHNSVRLKSENHYSTSEICRVVPSGGGFSFPILNPPPLGMSVLEDPPRESLEVFRRSNESSFPRKSHERRTLMTFQGDGNQARRFPFAPSPKNRSTLVDDDVMSDASSDLFEIESFSNQSTLYPMYRRRDSLDEASSYDGRTYVGGNPHFRRSLDDTMATPSIAPTECYEPSEVSIDWSVTTAEGFDRGSVTNVSVSASDYDVIGSTPFEQKVPISGITSKRRGSGLLSCRCEKAVNVGPHPVKVESGRFQVTTSRLGDISSMKGFK